jgi:hypothetical protein
MRDRRRLILLPLLLLLVSAPAAALDISVFASYWETDDVGSSLGFGGRVGFGERMQFQAAVSWYDTLEEDLLGAIEVVSFETDVDVIPVDLGVAFFLRRGGGIYVGGGASYYLLDSDQLSLDDEVGYYLLAGIQFSNFFIEAMLREVEGTAEGVDLPDFDTSSRVDLDLSGTSFRLGWRF